MLLAGLETTGLYGLRVLGRGTSARMSHVRHVPDSERRARLAVRQALAASAAAADPEAAVRALTVLHATEPATVYLSLWARVPGVTIADIDRALYDDRTLVKQLAMRRTLFVFPRALLPAAWGSASARVAAMLRTRLAKEAVTHGLADDGEAWLDRAMRATLARLEGGEELSATRLREEVPELAGHLELSLDKKYGGRFPVAPRVLAQLAVEAEIVRGHNAGHWRTARPLWTPMSAWLGESPSPLKPREGYAELVRCWLRSFGPGTTEDVQWWLGATKTATVDALADVGAVGVSLDGEAAGWLLPDDLDEVEDPGPWVALLPVLDATVMGWKGRDFYVGRHGPSLFDRNGNAGTTAWVDGRIVGCWVQDDAGTVRVHLLEPVPDQARAALDAEAVQLTAWLDGDRVSTVYSSAAMKEALG
jgi:winged helix DNA-binding protein